MFELRSIRNTRRSFALVCVGLLVFLLARMCFPSFTRPASHSSGVRSRLSHDHRPYFDPVSSDHVLPPSRTSVPGPQFLATLFLPIAADPFVPKVTFGVQYNRPPPLASTFENL